MNPYALIIVLALLTVYILNMAADILNLSMIRDNLPPAFASRYDREKYQKSQEYLRVNTRFEWIGSTVSLIVLFLFWFLKGFQILDHGLRQLGLGPVLTGILFMGILIGAKALLSLPFSIYNTFVIEQEFGFNTTTPKVFITDRIKGLFLAVVIGVPILSVVLWFFEYAGPRAWIYCWAAIVVIMVLLNYLVPTVFMPLFNRFEPIEDGELKSALMAYAKTIAFPLTQVFRMDGSKRSSKSNAFFTGFGNNKRIVLFDTLIERHTTAELVAVLAHEMGHYKLRHILKTLIIGIVQTGFIFYVLSLCLTREGLFEAFYVEQPSVYAGLIFFSLLYTPVDLLTGILINAFSRKNEFEADHFAVTTTGDKHALKDALIKLSVDNLGNLYPHPMFVFLHYSHPPVMKRIEAMEAITV
ncbi:M48 family metallopeptidase [Desulfatiferula olefinivorans]